jgi:hypothetical protein
MFSLALTTFQLAAEAQQVASLRMLRLMAGGAIARREMNRMVTEKVWTFAQASMAAAMASGSGRSRIGLAEDALGLYRGKVRANRRRLGRQ